MHASSLLVVSITKILKISLYCFLYKNVCAQQLLLLTYKLFLRYKLCLQIAMQYANNIILFFVLRAHNFRDFLIKLMQGEIL